MILLFNGPPGTGKDEACLFLESMYGMTHLSFKKTLFEHTIDYYNVSKEWFMEGYQQGIKERKEPALAGLSRREAMIFVSEEVYKPLYGKEYFGYKLCEKINKVNDYCFSDGGFLEEIKPVINTVGNQNISIVQLVREGSDFSKDSRRYIDGDLQQEYVLKHKTPISKQHILPENLKIRTYRIYNNSTVEDFHNTLRKIIKKERDVYKKTYPNEFDTFI